MVRQRPHLFAHDVGFEMELLQGSDVLGSCSYGHLLVLLFPNKSDAPAMPGAWVILPRFYH